MMTDMYIGTYTGRSNSRGVYRVSLSHDGKFSAPELICEARDPSYIALAAGGARLYAVDEQSGNGGVVSFELSRGAWRETGRADSRGGAPCHLALAPDGNELAVANYDDGVVTVCALSNGTLTGGAQALPARMDAPGIGRQERSHAHMCAFFGGRLLVCDLGCDMVRAFDRIGGLWRESEPLLRLPAGAGPRHMAIGGAGVIYVLGELDSRLHVFMPQGDAWRHAAAVALTPADREGRLRAGDDNSGAGAIKLSPDGRRMLCTTRQDNRVCLLDVAASGMPAYVGAFDCGGCNPRDAEFVDGYIVCACQDGGGLICLKPDANGGAHVTDSALIDAPVCILNVYVR